VRTLEVVRVDEEHQPPLTVGKVSKDRPRQKLVPQRFPESLDFPERLRVLRPALDVSNALAPKLLLEFRAPPPCRVLPALVRQDFLRVAVGRDAAPERLHHQARPLMMRHRVRHHEARMVVHEADHVEPLVTAQEKREDVRLPELIRLRSLEAPGAVLVGLRRRACLRHQPLLVQDPTHLCLTHPEALEARQHRLDAPRPVLRVLLTEHLHPSASCLFSRRVSPPAGPTHAWHQRLHSSRPVRLRPGVDRLCRHPERFGELRYRRPAFDAPHNAQPELHRVRHPDRLCSCPPQAIIRALPRRRLLPLLLPFRHLRLSFRGLVSSRKGRRCYLFST